MALSPEDIERRIEALRLARANSLIEGLRGEPDGEAVLDEWARGTIDQDEVMRRLDALLPNNAANQKDKAA